MFNSNSANSGNNQNGMSTGNIIGIGGKTSYERGFSGVSGVDIF